MNRLRLVTFATLVWGVFAALFITDSNPYQLENIFGVISLAVMPGMFTLAAFGLKDIPLWGRLTMSIALSLLLLMLTGLLGNTLLPMFGIVAPLQPMYLLIETTALFLVTMAFAWPKLKGWGGSMSSLLASVYPGRIDLLVAFLPSVLAVQAALGAFRINNGGDDVWTMWMLAEATLYLIFLTYVGKKVSDDAIATGFSFVGLALLFMTSLRGWFITGHDIQNEYMVFMFTETHNLWSMEFYRDPYNACLSITILPAVFAALLRFADVYIYKFLFQIFFAVVPGLVYLINRNWLKKGHAILATIYFIGFPTFFLDMPFLIRQEIAFLFFSLMIYIIFEKHNSLFVRRSLFMIFGFGVVISHYSTTYTVILIMLMACVARPFFLYLFTRLLARGKLQDSSLALSVPHEYKEKKQQIALWMVIVFALMSFMWTSLVTKTGGHLGKVINATFLAVKNGFVENNRSVDVANLLSFSKASQQQQLDAYIEKSISQQRKEGDEHTFFAVPDEKLSPTAISRFLDRFLVDTASDAFFFGQIIAKLMQVLAPFGLLYVFFRRRYIEHINSEIFLLSVASFLFIAMNIVLPVLSNEYGILRALQQSLFIISFLIVVATVSLGNGMKRIPARVRAYLMMQPEKEQKENIMFPLAIAILFFAYGTAFLLQLFGGNNALLHLNNGGRYYDTYHIRSAGTAGANWISNEVRNNIATKKDELMFVQIDHSSLKEFTFIRNLDISDGIFPGIIHQYGYVFVEESTFRKAVTSVLYGGDLVRYTYPTKFLEDNKNLIYDNGVVRIYR